MIEHLHAIVSRIESSWHEMRVLVVGDVMLDRYIWGDVERISPEAPVPVVSVVHRSEQPGGAANVAMNIAGLGAHVTLAGFVGVDDESLMLKDRLELTGIASHLISVPSHPTTSKLRIFGGQQQMLRLDVEKTHSYPAEAYTALLAQVHALLPTVQVVVLSDYAKGVLSQSVCRTVIEAATDRGIPVLVGPKHRDFSRYRGATTICPNLQELSAATGLSIYDTDALLHAAVAMLPELDLAYLTVTLSKKGIAVVHPSSTAIYPAVARQVFDVSGAGDTVIATLALALASGLEIDEAVPLANLAAGIVIGKVGTAAIHRDELMASLMPEIELEASQKLLTLEDLKTRMHAWRSQGDRVVFTNGCFDLLHFGHTTLMEAARRQGDRLIVAINSDSSVALLKGPTRPVVSERDRARVLTALAAVDAVIIFSQPTPLELIVALRPDVIVKGGDYTEHMVVGAREVRSWGGSVAIVPTVEGYSATRLVARAATRDGSALR